MNGCQVKHTGSELELSEVQSAALRIFKIIDEICCREGMRYWLAFGTLLGAVRHKGFIPWDDDIDIVMPRNDYERFLDYFRANKDRLRPLVIVNPVDRPGTPFLITRVSDTTYKMIGEFGDYVSELGVFVDIYPLDGLGNDLSEAESLKRKSLRLVSCYTQPRVWPFFKDQRPLHRVAKALIGLTLQSPDHYRRQLDDLCRKYDYDDSIYVTCLAWVPYFGFAKRSYYDATLRLPFEDTNANVPAEYDQVLTDRYGNYMELPPASERVPHHFYSIVKR